MMHWALLFSLLSANLYQVKTKQLQNESFNCLPDVLEDNITVYPPPPRNLSYNLYLFFNGKQKIIRATLLWYPPSILAPVDGFDLTVISSNDNQDIHCLKDFNSYHEPFIPKENTQWQLPHENSSTHRRILIFGCNYTAEIKSVPYPFDNSSYVESIIINIPNCIDGICGCGELSKLPPPSNLTIHVSHRRESNITKNASVEISWSFKEFWDKVVLFEIQIGHVSLHAHWRVLYRWLEPIIVPYEKNQSFYGITLFNIHHDDHYKVQIYAVDNQMCDGYSRETDFEISNYRFRDYSTDNTIFSSPVSYIAILIPSIVSFFVFLWIVFIIAKSVQKYQRKKQRHQALIISESAQSRMYLPLMSSPSSSSGPAVSPPISANLELSVISMEKEIQDAIEKGLASEYEFNYNRIEFGELIGGGSFGEVYISTADSIAGIPGKHIVAVKKLKDSSNLNDLSEILSKVIIMQHRSYHPNVVTLFGCCTLQQPYCLITEYISHGNLLKYLRMLRYQHTLHQDFVFSKRQTDSTFHNENQNQHVDDKAKNDIQNHHQSSSSAAYNLNINVNELLLFALQVDQGMEYLTMNGITHCNLTAKNILIAENMIIKISDFGLLRKNNFKSNIQQASVRWLALETLSNNIFNEKSDVWAFGVVLWEICTLGGFPYASLSDSKLLQYLIKGKRLEKVESFSDEVYNLMMVCWSQEADTRPTFTQIGNILETFRSNELSFINFDQQINLPTIDEAEDLQTKPLLEETAQLEPLINCKSDSL